MQTLNLAIRPQTKTSKKILVEINAGQFERLAANFGFFNQGFLDSLDKAEADIRAGRVYKIRSLKQLRNKK
jgi:hypothetical protein